MSSESLRFELSDGVARVTRAREKAGNALDLTMAKALMETALRCDEDAGVRAILITGAGKMFCAGGDVGSFASAGEQMPSLVKEITTYLHAALSRFARMRAPVIAAVNGMAAGAGMSMACAADLAICAESARFTMAYTRVGLAPDGSSSYHLPRLIGNRRTLELMLTNRVLSAQEALDWGMVNRVVPDDQLHPESEKLAKQLADGPTGAFASVKRLVLASASHALEAQMELESRAIADAARSADGREGVQAFVEKRAPQFEGD